MPVELRHREKHTYKWMYIYDNVIVLVRKNKSFVGPQRDGWYDAKMAIFFFSFRTVLISFVFTFIF